MEFHCSIVFFSINTHIIFPLVSNTSLKVVPTTFVLVYFLSLNQSTCQTRKNVFYSNSKALLVLGKIKF